MTVTEGRWLRRGSWRNSYMSYRKLWIALGVIIAASFAVLGGVGDAPQAGAQVHALSMGVNLGPTPLPR